MLSNAASKCATLVSMKSAIVFDKSMTAVLSGVVVDAARTRPVSSSVATPLAISGMSGVQMVVFVKALPTSRAWPIPVVVPVAVCKWWIR